MVEAVLDASAILALLRAEPGGERVKAVLPRSAISAVNVSEVVAKLSGRGMPESAIRDALGGLGLDVIPFDDEQAYETGLLRFATRRAGLSLGDRSCLALAIRLDVPAITADRTWKTLADGVKVELIR